MRISFNKNKSTISHWPTEALIFMQRHWHVMLLSQVLLPGCQGEAASELSMCQHCLHTPSGAGFFWRDYISEAQLIRWLLATRLFYSSSWGGFPLESWTTSSLLSRDCGAVGELSVPRLAVWGAASLSPIATSFPRCWFYAPWRWWKQIHLLWYLELLSLQIKHKSSICLWLQSPLLFSSSAVTSQ